MLLWVGFFDDCTMKFESAMSGCGGGTAEERTRGTEQRKSILVDEGLYGGKKKKRRWLMAIAMLIQMLSQSFVAQSSSQEPSHRRKVVKMFRGHFLTKGQAWREQVRF